MKIAKLLARCDVFINMPCAKSHAATQVSFGLKNLMGLIFDRTYFHSGTDLHTAIAELATVIKPHITILDATRALVTGGPTGPGKVQDMGTIIAGTNPLAVDVRYEQGKSSLAPSIGVFGASTRIESGPKTERFKRSRYSVRGWSGEKTTGFETDFFTGNFENAVTTIRDIDYIKNRYYRIDSGGSFSVDDGSEAVFVDDGSPDTDTPNTLKNYAAAGITGDFDRLHPIIDYTIDYEHGEILFLAPKNEQAVIVVTGLSGGVPFERVIKREGETGLAVLNSYFSGGTEITIFSLTHNNLIRNSETCIVDGEVLTGGEDYVLDYTSGTLLIIKEGRVYDNRYVRFDFSPADLVQINSYFRGKTVRAEDTSADLARLPPQHKTALRNN